jgi:hypothetical protein
VTPVFPGLRNVQAEETIRLGDYLAGGLAQRDLHRIDRRPHFVQSGVGYGLDTRVCCRPSKRLDVRPATKSNWTTVRSMKKRDPAGQTDSERLTFGTCEGGWSCRATRPSLRADPYSEPHACRL